MIAILWLAAGLACAQFGGGGLAPVDGAAVPFSAVEDLPAPKPAASKMIAVTVYRGQALVTRDVIVPEGEGTIELVVTPMPPQTLETSLYAEGTDGLRVLSTRFRTRAVREDTRKEVRLREELLKKLAADAARLQKEITVQQQDLQYVQKLEGFTGTSLNALTEKGRLDSEAILSLSKYVMETRGEKSKAETTLREQLQANTDAAEFAKRELAELSSGSSRIERDAVISVQKLKRDAGVVKLGYLVGAANWSPQYRLRGAADNSPVKLEYLAALTQQTGEDWRDVRITLSTSRPSLDAAPPDLLPLKMASDTSIDSGPVEAGDERSQKIAAELSKFIDMPFKTETPLEDVINYVRGSTKSQTFPEGIPIYVDPVGLQESEKTMSSPVTFDVPQIPLRRSLKLILSQLELTYNVKGGLLTITSMHSDDVPFRPGMAGMGGGMGGMGLSLEMAQAAGAGAQLNREAADDQAAELMDSDDHEATQTAERDTPSVTFPIAGRLDIPSRREPQLLDVARIELSAEYYAKAVPVLTQRVYRLAKLTNKGEFVLLPGEATVYVGTDFVGRMRLPLVAAGEPFVAGFGVDPQVQVSRRLMKKTRAVQGGNQVFTYEFRIGLRNYRKDAVKVQLWDRLPSPQGESVLVNLVKTSNELSVDPPYVRTSKLDNLLRWDIDLAPGTTGDKAMYVHYEFKLEYARDLPSPRFLSGGLKEGPIGGGAMGGGMGGMGGGGFRSVRDQ